MIKASLLHLLRQLLRVLPDGLGQLGHRVEHQVVQDHLEEEEEDELRAASSAALSSQHTKTNCGGGSTGAAR